MMWDERYSGREYFYGKEPNDFLKDNIDLVKAGDSVLCLAEGEGRNAAFIARSQSSAHVTAVDASKLGSKKQKLSRVNKTYKSKLSMPIWRSTIWGSSSGMSLCRFGATYPQICDARSTLRSFAPSSPTADSFLKPTHPTNSNMKPAVQKLSTCSCNFQSSKTNSVVSISKSAANVNAMFKKGRVISDSVQLFR